MWTFDHGTGELPVSRRRMEADKEVIMSRGALLLSAGLLVCGLPAPALADGQGAVNGAVGGTIGALVAGATVVDEMTGPPYDYPPPYHASRPYAHSRYHHYAYSRYHIAHSPYHRHSGLEPYSFYNPEK